MCTVRGCGELLERREKSIRCPKGHSFDIARSGYINLAQPQDRRSRQPGDSKAVVEARRRLHDHGFSAALSKAIGEMSGVSRDDVVLDAGSGDGFYLGDLARQTGFEAHGIDISVHAADAAARRYPEAEWIVANADRFVPYARGAFSLVWSITGRMNPAEFHRVLRANGRLLIAVPAPDDLIELRGAGRDRSARTVETFARHFALVGSRRVTTIAYLDAARVEDVLVSIYRPFRPAPVEAMRLTFSIDLLLFEPRR